MRTSWKNSVGYTLIFDENSVSIHKPNQDQLYGQFLSPSILKSNIMSNRMLKFCNANKIFGKDILNTL